LEKYGKVGKVILKITFPRKIPCGTSLVVAQDIIKNNLIIMINV